MRKVAEERARVEAEECRELRQLKFREVFRALRELKENLETPEAKIWPCGD